MLLMCIWVGKEGLLYMNALILRGWRIGVVNYVSEPIKNCGSKEKLPLFVRTSRFITFVTLITQPIN
jgi:hypothetical protein